MPELIRRAGGEAAGPALVRRGATPRPSPRSAIDTVTDTMRTFNRNVMGFDELADGAQALADLAQGDADDLGEAWTGARTASARGVAALERDMPNLAGFARNTGLATEIAPALLTGGGSLGPALLRGGGGAVAPSAVRAAEQTLSPLASVMRYLGRKGAPMAKGAVTGGLSAELAGFAGEGDFGERLQDGATAAPLGAMLGAGVGPLLSGVTGAGNALKRLSTPAVDAAKETAGRILLNRIPIEDQIARTIDRLQLPFEGMGRSGESLARAVANVPGPGQEIAERALGSRMDAAPRRMLEATEQALGDNGGGYHRLLEDLDLERLTKSKPLYAAAHEFGPMQSTKLDALQSRPSIREGMRRARILALEEDMNPDELGMVDLDVMDDWASELAPDVGAQVERVAVRGGRARAGQGKSLVKYVADGGGIRDTGGEIRAMDGELWNRGRAFQRRLIGDGDGADGWAVRAWEGGYFPDRSAPPTEREFLDAIAEEMRGRPRYARQPDMREADRVRMLDEAEEMAYRGNPADDFDEDAYVGRPEPGREPIFTAVPTARSWDYVKRGMDDLIESKRDKVTGKFPSGDEQLRTWRRTRAELLRELRTVNPSYGEALDAYAGPSHQMDAMRLGRRVATGKMDPEDLYTRQEGMSADESAAMRLGAARGLADLFRGGNPQAAMRRLATDQVAQDRLRAAFRNDDAFGRFMTDVQSEADAAASRNRVLMGSRTTPLREEIDAANAAGGDGLGAAITESAARRIGGESWRSQAARVFLRSVEGMRQPSLNNPEVSRLLGEVLFEGRPAEEVIQAAVSRQLISPQEAQKLMPALAQYSGAQEARARQPVSAGVVRGDFIFYPDGTIEPL